MTALKFAGVSVFLLAAGAARADNPTPEQIEFFEKNVRPVLAEKCYACHNSKMKAPMAELRLDTRHGMAEGGDSGKVIVPGDPAASRLIQAISYQHSLKMPPSGKLPDEDIEKLTAWVKMGAPDPRDSDAPAAAASSAKKGYDFSQARTFWAFQPVRRPEVPAITGSKWASTPVDAFLLSKLQSKGLQPARSADRRALLRRVTFDLTGLPPTPAEISSFLNDKSPDSYTKVVERLLASPRYGERWARHWLDLVRYAETNGHEYDNDKHEPWRYRDYLIRSFNEDVPYDQLVREQIAGDLLPRKRMRKDGGAWESPVGTTQLWFNEVLNSATDSEKSRADDVDNQIDVAAKSFLGLTVACARCHDHKFDPIPTADYYALAGVFHSTELREAVIDSPERTAKIQTLSHSIKDLNSRIENLQPRGTTTAKISYRPEDKIFEAFDKGVFGTWVTQGTAFGSAPTSGVADSRAAGSDAFSGTLTSAKFKTGKELFLHVRLSGTKTDPKPKERGALRFTIVADGYKGQHMVPDGSAAGKWHTFRLTFERERICYFEIVDRDRNGHIAVDEIVFSSASKPPETVLGEPSAPTSLSSENQAKLDGLMAEKRALEAQIPDSEFAMVAEDRDVRNAKLHIRGSHKNLGEEVPRRFLQVVAGENQPAIAKGSGRLEIAEWMASAKNPLTARVMVNRIWKHHFGQGLVRSVDNFGKMGEVPSHPELLDYLASHFMKSGWSIKALHRAMVLSNAYQMETTASELAAKIDPNNVLLQHMPVRRLEAEAIRDAILTVSGTLNTKMFGPSITPHISAYQDGRGKPVSGPLDGDGRRSIYVQVRRNFMTPMFMAFDYPSPISTIGARTVSTVPSQALLMMNNEFVAQQAGKWAASVIAETPDLAGRVQRMYEAAFARPASADEVATIKAFADGQQVRSELAIWSDVAHVLFNSAEFIYVQ